jgi:hypothetical protein
LSSVDLVLGNDKDTVWMKEMGSSNNSSDLCWGCVWLVRLLVGTLNVLTEVASLRLFMSVP